jgi:hypothetical protein
MVKRITFAVLIAFLYAPGYTQSADPVVSQEVPIVAMIGEYEQAFASLAEQNPGILLSVCGNDMEIAYEKWTDMLVAMEDYAESINFDINGLKTYLYIFWNADGSFLHLGYYPKSLSRNIPPEELTAFFKGFTQEYKMQIRATEGYSHYGSASFPTHARPEYRANKD